MSNYYYGMSLDSEPLPKYLHYFQIKINMFIQDTQFFFSIITMLTDVQ